MFLHILLSIIAFLVTIAIVIGIHEFGHFAVAKMCGVKVLRFSIGFGKSLWSKRDKRGTEYQLAAIPMGGYVKLLDTREGDVNPAEESFAFDKKPVLQRFAILLAGPVANLILAFLVYWFIFSIGFTTIKPVIGEVLPNSIAAKAGFNAGNEIISVGDQKTSGWRSVMMELILHYGEQTTLSFHVIDSTKAKTINVALGDWHLDNLRPDPLKSLGVVPFKPKANAEGKLQWPTEMYVKHQFSIAKALVEGLKQTAYFIKFNVVLLYKLVTGTISWQSLGGPFSLFQSAGGAAHQGVIVFLSFLALISISIGIANLLPIPGLDGSQLVYCLYEMIIGRPVPINVQILAFRIGLIILCLFMIQIATNDLLRLGRI